MEYPLILIDKVDTPRSSKCINIGIELRNAILKQLLEAANEGGLTTWYYRDHLEDVQST